MHTKESLPVPQNKLFKLERLLSFVNFLPWKHKDLSYIPSTDIKSLKRWHLLMLSILGRQTQVNDRGSLSRQPR